MGHRDPWDYTPAQARAFVLLGDKRGKRDRALDLSLMAMAFRAEGKDINRKVSRDLAEE